MNKPHAAAAEQNRDVIFEQLTREITSGDLVLEIGTGTGQHISYFAEQLPDVTWQPSDLASALAHSHERLAEVATGNLLPAIALDVQDKVWPITHANVCYTANTLHIMSAEAVEKFFYSVATVLLPGGKLCVYGPFSVEGQHTSDSNKRFDQMLRVQDPASGVRDLTQLDTIARAAGFLPARRTTMPVNNLFVVWQHAAKN